MSASEWCWRLVGVQHIDYVRAEHPPEERLVAPISWATLGTHVVASPGSHGALEGGGLSVHSFFSINYLCKKKERDMEQGGVLPHK